MEAGDYRFDQGTFRNEIQNKLGGSSTEQLQLFAPRCAWRAVPLVAASERLAATGWWLRSGDGYLASLLLSWFSWEELLEFFENEQSSITKAATYARYAAASAANTAAKVSVSATADDVYAAFAAFAAIAANSESVDFTESAANAAADAADAATAYHRFVFGKGHKLTSVIFTEDPSPLFDNIRKDAELAATGGLRKELPLWNDSTADSWIASWRLWVEKLAKVRTEARLVLTWLKQIDSGNPPTDEMAAWLKTWWARHSGHPFRIDPTELEPPEPDQPQPILIPRAHITSSVLNDGEAPELTPTARQCAEALHQFLASRETRPPITVSVEAPWGGGKSSVMRYLRRLLEQRDAASAGQGNPTTEPIPTVWFNPWKHEAGKTMWAAFAVAFERQLRAYRRPRRKRYTAQIAAGATRATRSARAKALLQNAGSWPPYLARIGWHKLSLTGWHFKLSWLRLTWPERILLAFRLGLWGMLGAAIVWLIRNGIPLPADQVPNPPTPGNGSSDLQPLFKKIPWVAAIAGLWALIHDLVKQFGSPLKLDVVRLLAHNQHRDGLDDLHRFQEDFRRLLQTYVPRRADGGLRRIVVFIDDLDRCEAPKAADVLQSLFQMLHVVEDAAPGYDPPNKGKEVPGIITILGMDREKVAASVAAKHESLLPYLLAAREEPAEGAGKASPPDKPKVGQREIDFGHSYLEKFIQLTLHLPPMQGKDQVDFLQKITGWSGEDFRPKTKTVATPVSQLPEATPEEQSSPVKLSASKREVGPPTAVVSLGEHSGSNPEKEIAAAEKRAHAVDQFLEDGQIAFTLASHVARALDQNPRKLKQFVNLFRFRLFLAAAFGHLDEATLLNETRGAAPGKLSAQQIAKLVALEIACPKAMNKLRDFPADKLLAAVLKCGDAAHPEIMYLVNSAKEGNPSFDLKDAPLHLYFHLE